MSKNKKLNSKAITESQIRNAVVKKIERLEAELKRNPNNYLTSQRVAELKRIHAGKL